MKTAPYIVFGAWDKPNKGTISFPSPRTSGYEIHIVELENDGSYDFGDTYFPNELIQGEYCTLMFCKKKALRSFIDGLEKVYQDWEEKE